MKLTEMSILSSLSFNGTRCINEECDCSTGFIFETLEFSSGSLPEEKITCPRCGVKWFCNLGHRDVYRVIDPEGVDVIVPRASGPLLIGASQPISFGMDVPDLYHAVRELLDHLKAHTLSPRERARIIANVECRMPQNFEPWSGRFEGRKR